MNINIKTIPHSDQRYETVGDYWDNENGDTTIVVSKMDDDFEFLIAIHEMAEQYLCKKRGIKEEDITAFDEAFEAKRVPGNVDEPGDDPEAPYHNEHCIATAIERLMCAQLGRSWKEYEDTCIKMSQI